MRDKRLYRSTTDVKVAGVCAGVAEYLDIDATIVRLITVVAVLFSGVFPGLIVYLLAALIIPKQGEER